MLTIAAYLLLAALVIGAGVHLARVGYGLRASNRRRDEAVERFAKRYVKEGRAT